MCAGNSLPKALSLGGQPAMGVDRELLEAFRVERLRVLVVHVEAGRVCHTALVLVLVGSIMWWVALEPTMGEPRKRAMR